MSPVDLHWLLNMDQPTFWFHFTEDQVLDLATGLVPKAVQAQCLFALDTEDELRRNAEKPARAERRKRAKELAL